MTIFHSYEETIVTHMGEKGMQEVLIAVIKRVTEEKY